MCLCRVLGGSVFVYKRGSPERPRGVLVGCTGVPRSKETAPPTGTTMTLGTVLLQGPS